MSESAPILILTGPVQSGKSSLLEQCRYDFAHLDWAGILAKGLWRNNQRHGFDVLDLRSMERSKLARRDYQAKPGTVPFIFYPEGLKAGRVALNMESCARADIIGIDEIGKLELAGQGWAGLLEPVLTLTGVIRVLVIRDFLLEAVCARWEIIPRAVIDCGRTQARPDLYKCLRNVSLTGGKKSTKRQAL